MTVPYIDLDNGYFHDTPAIPKPSPGASEEIKLLWWAQRRIWQRLVLADEPLHIAFLLDDTGVPTDIAVRAHMTLVMKDEISCPKPDHWETPAPKKAAGRAMMLKWLREEGYCTVMGSDRCQSDLTYSNYLTITALMFGLLPRSS